MYICRLNKFRMSKCELSKGFEGMVLVKFLMLIKSMRWSNIVSNLSTAGSDMIEQREMILGLRKYEVEKLNFITSMHEKLTKGILKPDLQQDYWSA